MICRAVLECIKTGSFQSRDCADPAKPGVRVGAYTTVANGVLASSYLHDQVGHYLHAIVGRGSHSKNSTESDGSTSSETDPKKLSYFQ